MRDRIKPNDVVLHKPSGTKHGKTYLLAVELAKAQIEDVKGAGESE